MDVKFKETIGRYGIANKTFQPGNEIFSEVPFAYGPKADSPMVCLGCYKLLDGATSCSICGWPVCGKTCELISAHKDAECRLFSKSKTVFYKLKNSKDVCLQYECITPLRILLAKEADPKRWKEEVEVMEAHNSTRRDTPIWKFNQINIVNYLRGPCKLENIFSEDLIHTVCGILESNAFEARTLTGHRIRCLYPKLAIMSHNCVSNINHSISCAETEKCDFRVMVKAAIKIEKGEELFSSYTYSLWPTLIRREYLKQSKYFDCCCLRCSDPSELGTHLSTLKCETCTTGFVMATNPLDNNTQWKCSGCQNEIAGSQIKNLFTTIQEDLDSSSNLSADELVKYLEELYQKYTPVLHLQNAYLCLIKSTLIQMYKTPSVCSKKIIFCEELLDILDVIEPGYSRIRGVTLFELATALINSLYSKRDYQPLEVQQIINILENCFKILETEPPLTTEGKMSNYAREYSLELKNKLEKLM